MYTLGGCAEETNEVTNSIDDDILFTKAIFDYDTSWIKWKNLLQICRALHYFETILKTLQMEFGGEKYRLKKDS